MSITTARNRRELRIKCEVSESNMAGSGREYDEKTHRTLAYCVSSWEIDLKSHSFCRNVFFCFSGTKRFQDGDNFSHHNGIRQALQWQTHRVIVVVLSLIVLGKYSVSFHAFLSPSLDRVFHKSALQFWMENLRSLRILQDPALTFQIEYFFINRSVSQTELHLTFQNTVGLMSFTGCLCFMSSLLFSLNPVPLRKVDWFYRSFTFGTYLAYPMIDFFPIILRFTYWKILAVLHVAYAHAICNLVSGNFVTVLDAKSRIKV